MQDHDPILESALEEALGGKAPPDLIAATLAKAAALPPAAQAPLPAMPRPHWRAWGAGLAAAAALVVGVGVFALNPADRAAPETVATNAQEPNCSGSSTFDPSIKLDLSKHKLGNHDGDVPEIYFATPQDSIEAKPTRDTGWAAPLQELEDPSGMIHKGHGSNPFVDTEDDAQSTFGLEHDSGSHTMTRAYLGRGTLPPDEAVRVEEFVNYFDYRYAKPLNAPFEITMDGAPSRYGADLKNCYLMRVGVQARQIDAKDRKPAVLTFVIDISGSMAQDNRLGLVKQALKLLVEQLQEGDRVGIAVYGSNGAVHMEHVDASRRSEITNAIDRLSTQGATNAEEGLKIGYQMATGAYRAGHTNRVILCSDGVANVGATGPDGILKTIVENRRKGITLSAIGFGMGNYNDHLMEQLGDKGDGHYAYVDTIDEAKRIFVDNLTGALEVVGRDVKIQVDFNPKVVKSYRLIGYVNRDIRDEDFRNDAVDGGEIGAGHAATALYEIKLHDNAAGAVAYAKLRYRTDEEGEFAEIQREMFTRDLALQWDQAAIGLRLAGNVAEFAEILGKGFYAKGALLAPVIEELNAIAPEYRDNKVEELLALVKKAEELKQKE
ncbi:MAG: von Willebrand factor type A domain-containing protein [Planctomycetes bacterium]|nr:von Willebrand factor type A domain-containing protein [Planctomycetota bacterium]